MAFGHAGEAVELGAVALERDHQRAVGDGAGIGLAPQREAPLPESPDRGSALSSSQSGASMAPAYRLQAKAKGRASAR